MALVLGQEQIQRHNLLRGQDTVTLSAGEKLVIKSGPQGALTDLYNGSVPAGKVWTVLVFVQAIEVAQ